MLHVEGFGTRKDNSYFNRLYDTAATTFTGSVGVRGRRFNLSSIIVSNMILTKRMVASGTEDTLVVQFAIRKLDAETFGSSEPGIFFSNDDGEQCKLILEDPAGSQNSGHLQVSLVRGSTTIATSRILVGKAGNNNQAWHCFQLKVTMTNAGSYELRYWDFFNNQETLFSGSADLQEQTTSGAHTVAFSAGTSTNPLLRVGDYIVMDTNGAANNDLTSVPLVVFPHLPNGDGNQNDWDPTGTTHFVLVDDPPNQNDDNTKVTSPNVGDIELYDYENHPNYPTNPTIVAVAVNTSHAMENSGSRTLRTRIREGADETFGGSFTAGVAFRTAQDILEQNPTGTPGAWNKTDFESTEFGVEVEA